jgi:MFS transporter, MHS family, citrate/tricarballylate:H+ symporter
LFGTFTPVASTLLIDHTGDKASPGLWLMCAAVLGIVATLVVYRSGEEAAKQQALAA